jgi:hypothetical protein
MHVIPKRCRLPAGPLLNRSVCNTMIAHCKHGLVPIPPELPVVKKLWYHTTLSRNGGTPTDDD